jgi:hypothetical protein
MRAPPFSYDAFKTPAVYLAVLGLYTRNTGRFCVGVATLAIFPVVVNATGVVVVKIITSKCEPVTGGVTVETAVVPVTNERNVDGAIVAADAIVTGFGCSEF